MGELPTGSAFRPSVDLRLEVAPPRSQCRPGAGADRREGNGLGSNQVIRAGERERVAEATAANIPRRALPRRLHPRFQGEHHTASPLRERG